METFDKFWNYTLFTLSSGGQINVKFMIEKLFRENGIVIAFPQRDVHLDVSGPIEVRMD